VNDLHSELAYFRTRLGGMYAAELYSGRALPPGAIRKEVLEGPFKHLTPEEIELAIKTLEANFTTTQKRGSSISKDYRPWLDERKDEIDFYYWDRLKRYYLEGNVLPTPVIAILDRDTDDILDYSGNPVKPGGWARRGMVMGHVQSGKTTNYSALICKASDAGYKVIILLAGITNSLRKQTQERLDETFIGKKSIFHPTANEPLPLVKYATRRRYPAYGTSRDRDFTPDAAQVGFSLAAHTEPMLFVLKKNLKVLERLDEWLAKQAEEHPETLTFPLLLIDDEADNASINTSSNPRRTSAINGVIRKILGKFERTTYVGYTATPFANIFIDPDTDALMGDDDLFPRHFIKALDAPKTYVGSARVFADDGDLRQKMVLVADPRDFGAVLPLAHQRDAPVLSLPSGLLQAIRLFCLTRAIRVLRDQETYHCSMMINVSRFNDVQEKVLGHVYSYLDNLRNAIEVNSGLDPLTVSDTHMVALKADFEKEYSNSGFSFSQVMPVLPKAVATIKPLTVNMKGGSLDYSKHKKTGLHVIAVGGLALSRGLTLEGLTISYILRNTAASDTLMQMARWFGYRPGYEDLCRVILPQLSLDHYSYVHIATEELRGEVKRMDVLGMSPEDFGLCVRQSDLALRVTAANKMRTATQLTLARDYSCRHVEGYELINDNEVNKVNVATTLSFVHELGHRNEDLSNSTTEAWTEIDGDSVIAYLKALRFPGAHPHLGEISPGRSLFMDYLSDRTTEWSSWDVALPHPKGLGDIDIAGQKIKLRNRDSGEISRDKKSFKITSKNRVADPEDHQLLMSTTAKNMAKDEKSKEQGLKGERAYCLHRTRPLLIVHLFQSKSQDGLDLAGPIATMSVCLPRSGVAPRSRVYQVNMVYLRQLAEPEEVDDDEAMLENEGG
jgi:hypothetical protein